MSEIRPFPSRLLYWFAILAAIFVATAARSVPMEGRAAVVDGDTLDIGGARVRLWGIDAPERAQPCTDGAGRSWPCGLRAADALRRWLGDAPLRCITAYHDRDGRAVARCTARGEDVAAWVVGHGWALDYPRFSKGAYRSAEAVARRARTGVWSGTFTPPWQWRAAHEKARQAAAPVDLRCPYKGNINQAGARIVHAPGQRDYDAVRIDRARGERWFCSLDEARRAGWRAAAR